MNEVEEYLKIMVKFQKDIIKKPDMKYVTIDDFILSNGVACKPQKYDKDLFDGVPTIQRECFRNAWYLSNKHDLIYVEGIAFNIIPTLHAWCVDKELNVYDPTWNNPENHSYFGVLFNDRYIYTKMAETEVFGVIDNVKQKFPLVSGKDTDFSYIIKNKRQYESK